MEPRISKESGVFCLLRMVQRMEENSIKKTKKILPHILYASVILIIGLAFVGSWTYFHYQELEMKKQEKIEREQETIAKEAEEQNNAMLREECLQVADREYWSAIRLNSTKTKSGSYNTDTRILDHINKKAKDAKDLCLKKYPTKY